jgi:hypothetical protein
MRNGQQEFHDEDVAHVRSNGAGHQVFIEMILLCSDISLHYPTTLFALQTVLLHKLNVKPISTSFSNITNTHNDTNIHH